MNKHFSFTVITILCFIVSIIGTTYADYQIDWYTIDGGGGTSSGDPYILSGTIGQPDAANSQGGGYIVLGGFWPGGPVCIVNLEHFARFAEYWLTTGTDLPADLYVDEKNIINLDDLNVFLNYWLWYCPPEWPLNIRVGLNSPSLCPTMSSETNTLWNTLPLCTSNVMPTNSGTIVHRRDHVRIGTRLPVSRDR